MAKLPLNVFSSGYSIYTMRGVEGMVMRRKGIKKKAPEPSSIQGLNNKEFAIRARAVKHVRSAMTFHWMLADYNCSGPMNALMKNLQVRDKESEFGNRGIYFSRHKEVLKGFSLNRYYLFDSAIRYPVTATINKQNLSALVHLPAIIPGINFFPQSGNPFFCLRAGLGSIPDILAPDEYSKKWSFGTDDFEKQSKDTSWYSVKQGCPAMDIEVRLKSAPPEMEFSLLLTIGLCFGELKDQEEIGQATRTGCAKVLEVA